jgi:hypothetical protein
MDDMEARMRRVEEAVIKLNHFTETFPRLMEEKIGTNRKLLYFILTAVVGGAIAVLYSVAQAN